MDKLASVGNAQAYKFPSAAISDETLDFSFSGLKTAVLNTLNGLSQKGQDYKKEDVAASFTASFTSSVAKKLEEALHRTGMDTLVLAGGVSANSHLRSALEAMCKKNGVRFCCPPLSLCGDNGAMIAAQAYYEYLEGNVSSIALNAEATSK